MIRMFNQDAQQQALGFLNSNLTYIEPTVYKIQYPDVQYPELVPVDTSANEWAKSITFYSMDQFGKAQWFNHLAKDVPIADVTRSKLETGVEMAAVGYRYTLEELGQAMMIPGTRLTTDRAEAARRAYEEFVDDVALRGDTAKGWTGLINDADVTVVQVPTDGAETGSPDWSDKTSDQILRDFNLGIAGIYTSTLKVEMADTVLMPVTAQIALTSRRLGSNSDMSIMDFLQKANVYTSQTGRPLTIRTVRGLETAGTGGTGRMVVYRRDPSVLKMHIPMPHRFLPVWQTGPMIFDIPGIFRLGGLEIRRPGAVRYIDGILDAAYE